MLALAAALLAGCAANPRPPAAAPGAAAAAGSPPGAGVPVAPVAPATAAAAAAPGQPAVPGSSGSPGPAAAPGTAANAAATATATAAATATATAPAAAKAAAALSVAPAASAAAAAPAAGAPAATPPRPGGPPGAPPFAQVLQGAERIEAPLVLWRRDDKVWIEIQPAQLGQPFLLSPKIREGISQAWVLGGLMAMPVAGVGGPQVVEFQRVHNQVRLVARNTDVAARPGTPEARALAASYSASLLGAAPLASQPHPERRSVLVEANALFLNDIPGIALMLQQGLRQGYGLDRGNSTIVAARGSAVATLLDVQLHFFGGTQSAAGGAAGGVAPQPLPLRFLPDARSMLVGLHYSLAPLPAQPMPARRADPRVGLFTTTVLDFGDAAGEAGAAGSASPRQRLVTRWRLEKKDPAAAQSPPVQPIVFWIDRNVPLAWRDTVREAVLEWNRAFERIGYAGAIEVRQQPDDADWDTLDFGVASVRWMLNAEPAFTAIGPIHIDPRSGEILDADIAFEGVAARGILDLRTRVLGAGPRALGGMPAMGAGAGAGAGADADADADAATPAVQAFAAVVGASPLPGAAAAGGFAGDAAAHRHGPACRHGELLAQQAAYALDVLAARGDLSGDLSGEPAAGSQGDAATQAFVRDFVKEAVMHEVGHALGLRHNFRASRLFSPAQLADPAFTREHGIAGSVMDYNAVNLPRPGEPAAAAFQTRLGPYDLWAIEYAYGSPPPDSGAGGERAWLQQLAERSAEPQLAFGTDEDAASGIDPETLQLDLGSDPLAFAARRVEIALDLFRRQETRPLPRERDYAVLRRSLDFALADLGRAMGVLARQIGGVRTLRDFPGSGRDPMAPLPAAVQRQALEQIAGAVLAADALTLSPALQRRLAPDYLDRADGGGSGTDYSLPQRISALQRAVLGHLMGDALAGRLLDGVGRFDDPRQAFTLAELHQRLERAVWAEIDGAGRRGQPIAPQRRELQRDHLNRLAAALLRASPAARADTRALLRAQARALLPRLRAAQPHAGDAATRAHLADSADTLARALAAPLQRPGL